MPHLEVQVASLGVPGVADRRYHLSQRDRIPPFHAVFVVVGIDGEVVIVVL